jgi:hypothetical protein
VTFAGGTANLGYDAVRSLFQFSADVAGSYQKRVEREASAWGVDAGAHVVTTMINPTGNAVSRGAVVDLTGDGEGRFYTGKLYGIGKAAIAIDEQYTAVVDAAGMSTKGTSLTSDFEVAVGGGYGRVLDVGAAIRVRRIGRTLDAARALGRPIDPATSKKLQLTWWALRGERSAYRALVATVAILREAGILLGEPDAGLTYELLNVLNDTQLYVRPSGFDVQVVFGEGYLKRPDDPMDPAYERGRIEQLLASASYGAQLEDDKLELSGTAYGRLRILADMGVPSPWAVGSTGRMRRFTYGDHGDPFGVFDLSGTVQLSDDDLMMSDRSLRVTGELGFTYLFNQASGLRLAAQVIEDGGELFVGGQLQATYGLLDGVFAR